jgi:hypothetical protein
LTDLLCRAADGDVESWAEINDRFTNLPWGIARSNRLSTEDSADVVQTTWLRLVENLRRSHQPEAHRAGWPRPLDAKPSACCDAGPAAYS